MMTEQHTPLGHGSFTEALLNHDPIDYSEWYSNFLTSSAHSHSSSFSISHTPLPSLLSAPSTLPTVFYTEQGLSRLAQQQHHDYNETKPVIISSQTSNHQQQQVQQQLQQQQGQQHLPTTLPLPVALPPSGTLPPFLSTPLPPQPILHTKPISIPEFTYASGSGLDLPASLADTSVWQLPEPLHRNYYHTIQFRVPSAAYATTPNLYGSYESYRVYIHPELGYSGNAKRFKQAPEAGEKAFMLEGTVLDSCLRPITQCAACEEYFENKSYFVANPHCKGRILLIKNNQVNRIKNNIFSLNLKPMCCSRHHQSPFYLHFVLRDTVNFRVVMSTLFMSHVKQWKKTSATPKRRKTTHTPSSGASSPSSSSSAATSPDISISTSAGGPDLE